jgi:hypothetical protein
VGGLITSTPWVRNLQAAAKSQAVVVVAAAAAEVQFLKDLVDTDSTVQATIAGADYPDSDSDYVEGAADLKDAPWWFYHQLLKGSFCKACIMSGAKSKNGRCEWTTKPSNNKDRKKKFGSTRHADTDEHKDAVEALRARVQMEETMDVLGSKVILFMEKRFKTMYYVIKNNLALSQYKELIGLEETEELRQRPEGRAR